MPFRHRLWKRRDLLSWRERLHQQSPTLSLPQRKGFLHSPIWGFLCGCAAGSFLLLEESQAKRLLQTLRERQVFSLLRAMRTESLSVSCACTLNRLVFLGRLMKPYKESNRAVAWRATPAKPSAETYVKISAPWRAIPATIPAGNFVTLYAQLKGDLRETISGKPRQFLCPMEGPLQRNISWKICLVLCHSVITEYFNHKCSLSKEELVFPDHPSVNASVSFIRDDWIVTTPFPSLTSKPGQGWIPFQVRQTLYLAPSMFLGPSHNARKLLLTGSYRFPPVPP